MEATTVIKQPLVTEKTTFAATADNRYSFEVDRRADKAQIKRAVEEIYGVRVVSVSTQVRKGRMRRNRMGWFRVGNQKRATVKLHAEDRIELF
ncbi:MAG: 50S ribosomal protein L23 [Phycisphaerae bacterium]|nr:50S ribosomal protein L23 [Phycisphaerae bacterium]MCH2146531.1 50S ribosomal protein L23 [Phycisphaerales bacterium]